MALAEPRRRQKWTLNPRGNLWANDTDKFGQKLMEKMGWEQGKGLGANQDGIVDPIKLRHKDNSKGIGFEGHDDTWLGHQEDFQAVLAALNAEHSKEEGGDSDDVKQKSLEETSKVSRKRVHYQKFTRGKDLANYSTDDLGCILGTKSEKMKKKKKKDKEETEEKTEVSEIGTQEKSHGLVVIQGGSYQEYFAKKMAELKAKGRTTYGETGQEYSEETVTYTEETQMIGFKAAAAEDELDEQLAAADESQIEDLQEAQAKKKKKKKSKDDQDQEHIENQAEPEQKKKKKSKKDKYKEEELIREEENLDENTNTTEEAVEPKKSKKSKKDKNKEVEEIQSKGEEEENLDKSAKKSKKKKKREDEVQNEEDITISADSEEKLKKKKKKKGKKEKNSDPPESAEKDSGCEEEEVKEKKKKKGKKEKKEEEEPERKRKHSEDNTEEPAKKKKKKSDDADKSLGFRGSNLSSINGYGQ